MRKLFILLAMMPFIISCSSSDDSKDIDLPKTGDYKVILRNYIDKSQVSKRSDGTLYDTYLLSQNGKIYKTGNVENGKQIEYALPADYDPANILLLILKVGKNASEARSSNYISPEIYYGKLLPIIVADKRPSTVTIDENTTYSQLKYSSISDVEAALSQIVSGLSK